MNSTFEILKQEIKNPKVNSEKELISFWILDGIIPIVPIWKLVNLFFHFK